jgi:branched-chain amino acid transport system substrate-binding protein
VYFQGALTGPYNLLVVPGYDGATLKVNELNADSSFPATILLKGADTGDQTNPTPAIQEAASDPNTVAIIGPAFSGETRAGGDTYNRSGIPFVTGSATAVDLASNHWTDWYRTVGNDNLQGGDDGQFVSKVLKCKKLFVSNDKSAYGQPLSVTVGQTAVKNGTTVVKTEGVAPTDNYSPLISDIKSSGADCVFYGGYDADFAKIVTQAHSAGLSVKWMSGDGSASSTFLSGVTPPAAANGVYLSTFSNLLSSFVAKFDKAYGSSAAAAVPVYSGEYYDVAGLIGQGIKQAVSAGTTDVKGIRSAIKKYLDGLTGSNAYPGVTKSIAFTSNHELAGSAAAFYFYQIQNGKIVQLGNATKVLKG